MTGCTDGCKTPSGQPGNLARKALGDPADELVAARCGALGQGYKHHRVQGLGAVHRGRPMAQVVVYRAKALAIQRVWNERNSDFNDLQVVLSRGDLVLHV